MRTEKNNKPYKKKSFDKYDTFTFEKPQVLKEKERKSKKRRDKRKRDNYYDESQDE